MLSRYKKPPWPGELWAKLPCLHKTSAQFAIRGYEFYLHSSTIYPILNKFKFLTDLGGLMIVVISTVVCFYQLIPKPNKQGHWYDHFKSKGVTKSAEGEGPGAGEDDHPDAVRDGEEVDQERDDRAVKCKETLNGDNVAAIQTIHALKLVGNRLAWSLPHWNDCPWTREKVPSIFKTVKDVVYRQACTKPVL